MKKIFSFLQSMFFTGILLIIFGIAIAYATFIENDYGTTTAQILIYRAWWFELLLGILCLNIVGSIFKHKLVTRKKWPMLLFHIAFIVIGIGAMVTRYYSYEGNMHIREGQASNSIVSTESFISVKATQNGKTVTSQKQVLFSGYTGNSFSDKLKLNGQTIKIKNLMFMPSATEQIIPDPMGLAILSMIAVDENMQRSDFMLEAGDTKMIFGKSIGFNPSQSNDIIFRTENSKLYITAHDTITVSGMSESDVTLVPGSTETEVQIQKLYSLGQLNFVVQQFTPKAKTELIYSHPQKGMALPDGIKTLVTVGDQSKEVIIFGRKGETGTPLNTHINGIDIEITYGSKEIELPFSLYLSEFQLERYPGSMSPSSYASEVILKDKGAEKPFRIYMNNILKYQGYRFFQSSYDTDEKGTILSVNHDALGTGITYFGYLIMVLGMVLGLFNKNSRFTTLLNTSVKIREERKKYFAIIVVGVLLGFNASAQAPAINKNHVKEFGELAIQNRQGRIEPVNTLASQILRKVAKKTSWEGMAPTEVFLDMQANPEKWKNIAIIKVSNPELRKQLGIYTGKYATFNSIVLPRQMGGYKLAAMVQQAYEKKSNERNKLDKEIIYVDERVNILMNVFNGQYLTIFPIPDHENSKWVSAANPTMLADEMALYAQKTIDSYMNSVFNNDWSSADRLLQIVKENQVKYGASVLPSPGTIKLEVFYNNINIFGKLSKIFMFTGLILLFIQLTSVFNPKIKLRTIKKLAFFFILLMFVFETAGLGIRWYISGHAPWSNGYESMIFVSWATCLGGLIFSRRSEITLSLTTVLAGLTLMVAGMSWMSPEITNLVPVLKSYWLIVHVAIITASYGFLGISALLGFLNLILMVFRTSKNNNRINFTVKELTNIIQIALIIGLLMLTVGSFLGGVWANESWGRYWGWDPKETWALVTILVYTFITHMHRIPGFKGNFAISAATLVGFSSVLMTYFGVNYYLSGLHSYAQGEAAPIPTGVYVAVFVVIVVIAAAFISEGKNKPKEETETI
ncbi:cytochrome c biogenesis protein CcsA [Prolixibacteraceae bacterium Z1-6]|uniref:Cytochrome c biogenesis protein CcsA n=1 Tax=Draconibacterium aestuarii TaxID=2998507 RepID=A0A9X3FBL8_9BACT|nr:cytochrome c biogenesis protein CcsA [Prolixibacteraceae bacterium Z1-6]